MVACAPLRGDDDSYAVVRPLGDADGLERIGGSESGAAAKTSAAVSGNVTNSIAVL
jgi:hypothetical protein